MDNSTREKKLVRRRSPSQWARVVEDWSRSGLSAGRYARQHGIGVGSLYRWSGRVMHQAGGKAQRAASSTEPRFLAVKVAEDRLRAPAAQPVASGGVIEVAWPGGAIVRVSGDAPVSTIAAVLRAMAEMTPC
jgi:transposase